MPKSKRSMTELNQEQRAAVLAWAKEHGAAWKRDLADAWYRAGEGVDGYSYLLQQVRNQFGPSWLSAVRL